MENTIDNLILTMNQEQVEQVLNIINSLGQEGKYKLSDENKAILSDLSILTTEEEIKAFAKTICNKEENLAKYIIEKTLEKDKKLDNLTDEQLKYYCEAIIELTEKFVDEDEVKNIKEDFDNANEKGKKKLLKKHNYQVINEAINEYKINSKTEVSEETEDEVEEEKSISEIFTQGINKFASINQLSKISLLKDLMKEWKRTKKCENKTEKKKKSLIKRIFNKKNLKRAATIALVASSIVLLGSFNPVAAASDFTALIAVAKVALPVSIAALASTKVVPGIVNLVKKKKSKTKRIKGKVNNNIITDVTKLRLEKILDEFTNSTNTTIIDNSKNNSEKKAKTIENPTNTKVVDSDVDTAESKIKKINLNTENIDKKIEQNLLICKGYEKGLFVEGERVVINGVEKTAANCQKEIEKLKKMRDGIKGNLGNELTEKQNSLVKKNKR